MQDEMKGSSEVVQGKPKLFGMIMNPREQFERIRERPVVWLPLLIVTVLTVIGLSMMAAGIDFMDQPGLEGIPAEELQMIETISKITFIVIGIISPAFAILISTVIYLVVAKIAHKEVGFKQLFSMNTYIYIISVLSMIINGIAFMVVGNASEDTMFTSLNSIVNASGATGALLNMIEVFSIWTLILNAIGLQLVGTFSKKLAWGVVIAVFLITASFMMISASLSTMLGA